MFRVMQNSLCEDSIQTKGRAYKREKSICRHRFPEASDSHVIRGEKSLSTNIERPHYLTWLVYRYIIRTTYSCGVPKPWVGDSQQWSSGPAFRVPGVTKFPPCNDWLAHGTAMGFHQHQPASLKKFTVPMHLWARASKGPGPTRTHKQDFSVYN